MRKLICVCFLFAFSQCFSQNLAWYNTIWNINGLYTPVQLTGMVADKEGNMYVSGNYAHRANFNYDTFIQNTHDTTNICGFIGKYSKKGKLIWVKKVRSPSGTQIDHFAIDETGNLYINGIIRNDVEIDKDSLNCSAGLFIAKLDGNGNVKWLKKTADGNGTITKLVPDNRSFCVKYGKIICTTFFSGKSMLVDSIKVAGNDPLYSFVASCWDTSGHIKWAKNYGTGQTVYLNRYKAGIDSQGRSYIYDGIADAVALGKYHFTNDMSNNDYKGYVTSFDEKGNLRWARAFSFEGNYGADINADASGNFFLSISGYDRSSAVLSIDTFHFNGSIGTNSQNLVLKFDNGGNLLWGNHIFAIRDKNNILGEVQTNPEFSFDNEGNIYTTIQVQHSAIAGKDTISFNNLYGNAGYIAKYKPDGTLKWIKMLGYPDDIKHVNGPGAEFLANDDSENVYFAANIFNHNTIAGHYFNQYGFQVMVGKMYSPDTFKVVDTTNHHTSGIDAARKDFEVFIYPNPAKDFVTIAASSAKSSTCEMEVTDIMGNTLYKGYCYLPQGQSQYPLEIHSYLPGVYTVSIQTSYGCKRIKFSKQ